MSNRSKSNEELIKELQELRQKYNSLKNLNDIDVTDHSQIEEDLDKMGSLAKIGNWKYNLQDDSFSWSKEAYKIFELAEDIDLSLEKVLAYYADESSGIIQRAINLAIEEGKSFIRDSEIITASGAHKRIRTQGVVVQNKHSKSKQIFGTIQDISEILLIDHETKKSVLTLDRIEQISHVGHWSVNIIDGSFYHSDEIKRIFGYEPSEYALSVEDAINAYHPDDRDKVISLFNRAVETGEGYEFDLRVVQPSGDIRFVHSKGYTEKNNEGKVIRVYGVFQDITEIMQAEQALHKSEALKRKMVSNIGDVVVIIDQNGINQYKSPNIKQLFGWDPEELIGKSTWDNIYPDDVQTGQDFMTSLATEPNATGTLEIRYKCKDGKYVWIEITIVNLLQDPDICGFLGNYHNISERKCTEQELIQAKEKAEESDRLKSAFLANMSHEIRTPMNGILGFASQLKKPFLTGEKQQMYIEIIEKSSTRMLNIINDIVDISKIEAGLMKVDMRESNINEQIEYVYTFFKPEAEAKGIKLSFNTTLSAIEATIKTDREKLFSILTNLVNNAIKYSNEGSIKFGYEKKGDHLEVYVKDTGIGIPKDRQEAIFERFIQADITDKMAQQGAGLGLAITKAYVEMLGGKIWVESRENHGSSFYFTLPYRAETNEKKLEKSSVASDGMVDEKNSKLKIILAEDDKTSEILISAILDVYSEVIFKVRTGIEAIDHLRENPDIDLVLMDIQMPEMNGYEATRQIRQFNKNVIIIAQTAYALSGDREKALEAGCNDYITKPIDEGKLLALIQKHLQDNHKVR